MRDAFNRVGVQPDNRRPGGPRQGNGGGKPKGPQTSRAVNLKRLVEALDYDLVATALGVSETVLRNLIADRAQPQDEQSVVHIVHKLSEAGLPGTWLHQHNATLLPAHVDRLKQMASSSDSKTAIRRSNLRKIVAAFPDRNELLADALELAVPSIAAIIDGQLEFNDQRFGHINPRLVAAGFPDGWLEQSSTELTADMIQGLETQATDAIERELAEEQELRAQAHVYVEPAATPAQNLEVAADSPEEVGQVAPPNELAAATAEASSQPALWSTAELPPGQQHFPNTTGAMPTNKEPFMAKAKHTPPPAPRPHPSVTTAHAAAAPTPTRAGAVPLAAAVRSGGPKRGASPTATRGAAKTAQAPAATKKGTPTFASTQPARKAGKVATKVHVFQRGTDVLTQEQSQVRVDALDEIFNHARRGAKVTLWRDLLGSSLPVWGNIRRGSIMFRDELADGAEHYLALPKGFLDNPIFPPPSLAEWVLDASVELPAPLPANVAAAEAKAAKKASKAKGVEVPVPAAQPAAAKPAPVQGSLIGMPPPAPRRPVGVALTTEAAHEAQAAAGVPVAAPAPVAPAAAAAAAPQAATPAVAVPSPAAAPAPARVAPAVAPVVETQGAGFIFTPPANPVPTEPGFLTQAVGGVVLQLAKDGLFTDDDALRLINYLKGAR